MNLNTVTLSKLAFALLLGSSSAGPSARIEWDTLRTEVMGHGSDSPKAKAAANKIIKNFSKRTTDFFDSNTGFDAATMKFLLGTAMGVNYDAWRAAQVYNSTAPKVFGSVPLAGDKIIKLLKPAQLNAMSTETCGVALEFLDYISMPADINEACRKLYFDNLDAIRPSTIPHIPEKWAKESTEALISAVQTKRGDLLNKLDQKVFKVLMTNQDDSCKKIAATTLTTLDSAHRALLTPSCVAEMAGLENVKLTNVVLKGLPTEIFSLYNGALHDDTTKGLTGPLLKGFASKVDVGDHRCGSLSLPMVTPAALAEITAECFAGFYEHQSAAPTMGKNLAYIPGAIFATYKSDEMEFVRNILATDFQYLPAEAYQAILNSESAIEKLHKESVLGPRSKSVTTTKTLFASIAEKAPQVAGQMLLNLTTLPEDVLAECSAHHIEELQAQAANGDAIEYNDIFEKMIRVRKATFKAIFNKMSEESNVHFCSTITSLSDYLNMKWLRVSLSSKCIQALPFDLADVTVLAQAPELSKDGDAFKVLIEKYKSNPSEWKNVSSSLMVVLAENPEFCSALAEEDNKEIFANLSNETIGVIGGSCAKTLKKFVTAENFDKFAVDVFSNYSHADFVETKIKLADVSVTKFPLISSEISVADSVFAKITEEEFKSIKNDQVAVMSAKQWAPISVKNIATVDADKLKLIKPTNMTMMTDAQLDAFTPEVIVTMSVEQIAEFGKEVNANLGAFDKVSSKLTAAQTDAIALRKSAPAKVVPEPTPETEQGSNIYLYVIVGVFVLVLVGGAIFFFVRK